MRMTLRTMESKLECYRCAEKISNRPGEEELCTAAVPPYMRLSGCTVGSTSDLGLDKHLGQQISSRCLGRIFGVDLARLTDRLDSGLDGPIAASYRCRASSLPRMCSGIQSEDASPGWAWACQWPWMHDKKQCGPRRKGDGDGGRCRSGFEDIHPTPRTHHRLSRLNGRHWGRWPRPRGMAYQPTGPSGVGCVGCAPFVRPARFPLGLGHGRRGRARCGPVGQTLICRRCTASCRSGPQRFPLAHFCRAQTAPVGPASRSVFCPRSTGSEGARRGRCALRGRC